MIFKVEEHVTFVHYVPAKDENEARQVVEREGSPARYRDSRRIGDIVAVPQGDDDES